MQHDRKKKKKEYLKLKSKQCKTEENNRMRKIRDLFKKLEISREHFMQRWAQYRTEIIRT